MIAGAGSPPLQDDWGAGGADGCASGTANEARQFRDEAIAAPDYRLDAAPLRPALVEDAAQRSDVYGEIALLDDGPVPHRGGNLVLRNQLTALVKQQRENVERAGAEGNRDVGAVLAAPEQAAPAAVEPKVPELEYIRRGESLHASPPS